MYPQVTNVCETHQSWERAEYRGNVIMNGEFLMILDLNQLHPEHEG